jgi:hypothetical protein
VSNAVDILVILWAFAACLVSGLSQALTEAGILEAGVPVVFLKA